MNYANALKRDTMLLYNKLSRTAKIFMAFHVALCSDVSFLYRDMEKWANDVLPTYSAPELDHYVLFDLQRLNCGISESDEGWALRNVAATCHEIYSRHKLATLMLQFGFESFISDTVSLGPADFHKSPSSMRHIAATHLLLLGASLDYTPQSWLQLLLTLQTSDDDFDRDLFSLLQIKLKPQFL